jgi:Short C-terminal domain
MFARRRPLLRAAVVGGGAYYAGRKMGQAADQRAADEAYQDDRISRVEQQQGQPQQYGAPQQQQYAAPPQQAAPAGPPSMADQLQQIAALHDQGVLSDDEFAAAKAKLLGG